MAGGDSKTEQATSKRRQDQRKKGNIFQSRDIVSVASLLIMFYSLKFLSPIIYQTLQKGITGYITMIPTVTDLNQSNITKIYTDGLIIFLITTLPLLLISGLIAIVFTGMQTKFLVSFQSIHVKFSKINPLEGFKRLISIRSIVELMKSLIKISIIGYVIYDSISKNIGFMPRLMDMSIEQSLFFTCNYILSMATNIGYIFIFIGLLDFGYQWWEFEKSIRMSKQEIKEEYKQTEGDPQIKGKIKEKQRAMAMSRMMQQVPSADVIIRNPTHFAVAIQYNPEKNASPIVVAKGMDHIALKIIEIAEQNEIVITENRPLARALYETVNLDQEIPSQFYKPVAEVLAFVYSLKKKELSNQNESI